jgi:hypothetical protein
MCHLASKTIFHLFSKIDCDEDDKTFVSQYINKFLNYSYKRLILDDRLLFHALIFFDRISMLCKNENDIYFIFVGCCILAKKSQDDIVFNNKSYVNVSGVDIRKLYLIECKVLELLKFNIFVSDIDIIEMKFKILKNN